MLALIPLVTALPLVLAASHDVSVGDGGLTFTPSTVTAAAGDTVVFNFAGGNHTATQSSFDSPCSPLAGGFNSGFEPVDTTTTTKPQYKVTVNDTNPIWVFCAQTPHCQKAGMVFAVNPPATGNTFDAFKAKATGGASTTTTSSQGGPTGAVHTVVVGKGGLTYAPASITAAAGDTVVFEFAAGNHTVTQSTFDTPCSPQNPGFNSGYEPVSGTAQLTYNVTVNDTTPIWGFCAQGNHCQSGMVFAINAPTNDPSKSFDKYVQNAKAGTNGTSTTTTSTTTTSGASSTNTSPTTTGSNPANTSGAALGIDVRESHLAVALLSVLGLILA